MSQLCSVNVFIGSEIGITYNDLRLLVSDQYDEDGNMIRTDFMKAISWDYYEPACVECICDDETKKIDVILKGCSYDEKFINLLPTVYCRFAILIYSPNEVKGGDYKCLKYLNSYEFL